MKPSKDFPTSRPATGGDAILAADLLTQAASAMSGSDTDQAEAVENARRNLEHLHPDVRVSAIAALSKLGSFHSSDLAEMARDSSAVVRRRVVEAAAHAVQASGGTDWLPGLIDALADEAAVAEVAAFALGEFGPDLAATTPAIEPLERMATDHPEALCRESAVAALGALHRGRGAILAALGDKATVRRRAVLALAPFEGDDVIAALRQALTDRDWQVRQAAEDQIGPLPDPSSNDLSGNDEP